MTTIDQAATAVAHEKLERFVGQMLGDLGGAFSVPLVRLGDRLGLYRTLDARGPMTLAELPTSLAQEVGEALGATAGRRRLGEVVAAGGFRHLRRAAETPFNMVLEARV